MQNAAGTTLLNSASGEEIEFRENNNTKMILKGGKVGIGTASPDQALSVIGVVRAASAADELEYTEIVHDGSDGYINTVGDGNLEFRHDGNVKMTLTSGGNLGIGTTSPTATLDIQGNLAIDGDTGAGTGTISDVTASVVTGLGTVFSSEFSVGDILIAGSNQGTVTAIGSDTELTVGTDALDSTVAASSFTIGKKTVIENSNVGIGTTAPNVLLQLGPTISHKGNYDFSSTTLLLNSTTDNGGNSPNDTESVLTLVREGINNQAYGNMADFRLGRYENSGSNARSQLDILLTDSNFAAFNVMSLRSNGNVGIGTTAPNQALSVIGTVRAANAADELEYTEITHDGGNGYINTVGDGDLEFRHDGSAKMSLSSDGKLGIGITPPLDTLDINGDLRVRGADIKDAGGTVRLTLSDAGDLDLKRDDGTTALAISPDGNITLHAPATSNNLNGLILKTSDNAFNQGIAFQNSGDSYTWYIHRQDVGSNDASLVFAGGNANADVTSLTARLVIDENGKVGIGTASPGQALSVIGVVRAASAADELEYTEIAHGGANGYINTVGVGNLDFRHDGVDKMTLTPGGNLGIGTTAPLAKLAVNGGVHVGGDSDPGDDNLQVDGLLDFGSTARQMIHLWGGEDYGIGVQGGTQYFRTGGNFAWFKGGSHAASAFDAGGGTVQMVIDDGKVGIGTTSPDRALSVIGTVRAATAADELEYTEIAHDGTNGFINTVGDGNLNFRHDQINKMTLTSAGNLGISDTSPEVELSVVGTLRAGKSKSKYVSLYHGNTNGIIDTVGGGGGLFFSIDGSNKMSLTREAKLGIGTTSPAATLDIRGNLVMDGDIGAGTGNIASVASSVVTGSGTLFLAEFSVGDIIFAGDKQGTVTDISSDLGLTVDTGALNGTAANTSFTIGKSTVIENSNVGIGTTTPGEALSVIGIVRAANAANELEYTEIGHGSNNGYINTVGDGKLNFCHDGSTKMTLTSSGWVGIGINTPEVPLHIDDRAMSTTVSYGGGSHHWSLACEGDALAKVWLTHSDARVKQNPQPLDSQHALEVINRLNLVDYEHIPEYQEGGKGRGVYAQELLDILPDAVCSFPKVDLDNGETIKDFLTVSYDWIFVTGMAAIQELDKQNRQLQEEKNSLVEKVDTLQQGYDELKAEMMAIRGLLDG